VRSLQSGGASPLPPHLQPLHPRLGAAPCDLLRYVPPQVPSVALLLQKYYEMFVVQICVGGVAISLIYRLCRAALVLKVID
jgi:hypothetical protein